MVGRGALQVSGWSWIVDLSACETPDSVGMNKSAMMHINDAKYVGSLEKVFIFSRSGSKEWSEERKKVKKAEKVNYVIT